MAHSGYGRPARPMYAGKEESLVIVALNPDNIKHSAKDLFLKTAKNAFHPSSSSGRKTHYYVDASGSNIFSPSGTTKINPILRDMPSLSFIDEDTEMAYLNKAQGAIIITDIINLNLDKLKRYAALLHKKGIPCQILVISTEVDAETLAQALTFEIECKRIIEDLKALSKRHVHTLDRISTASTDYSDSLNQIIERATDYETDVTTRVSKLYVSHTKATELSKIAAEYGAIIHAGTKITEETVPQLLRIIAPKIVALKRLSSPLKADLSSLTKTYSPFSPATPPKFKLPTTDTKTTGRSALSPTAMHFPTSLIFSSTPSPATPPHSPLKIDDPQTANSTRPIQNLENPRRTYRKNFITLGKAGPSR